MKPLKRLVIPLLCLAVIFTFLAHIARSENVLNSSVLKTQTLKNSHLIQYSDGFLTVNVQDVSLLELLQEIAHQCGLTVMVYGELDDRITIQFEELALDKGLRFILRQHNFILSSDKQAAGGLQSPDPPPRKLLIYSETSQGLSNKTMAIDGSKLGKIPKDVAADLQRLQEDLLDEDWEVRADAAEALGEIKRPEAIRLLSFALNDEDEDVRESVVYALANIGGDEAVQAITVALRDVESWVRESAVEALGEIGGENAVNALATALQDDDPSVREMTVEALGEIGGDIVIGLLEKALLDPDESVRDAAADVLERIKENIPF